jgi:hypothetical protein
VKMMISEGELEKIGLEPVNNIGALMFALPLGKSHWHGEVHQSRQ